MMSASARRHLARPPGSHPWQFHGIKTRHQNEASKRAGTRLAPASGQRADETTDTQQARGPYVAAVQSPALPGPKNTPRQLLILGSEDAPSGKNQVKRRANTQIDRFHVALDRLVMLLQQQAETKCNPVS